MGSCNNESIGRLIYKTSQIMRNYAEKLLKPYDLTVEQFHLLKQTSLDEGISQNIICQLVEKKPANITRILDRLEKKKWVKRQPNPSDRRSSLVFLTKEGERIIDEVSSLFESYSGRFVEGISPADEIIFRNVLEKINNNLNELTNEICQ